MKRQGVAEIPPPEKLFKEPHSSLLQQPFVEQVKVPPADVADDVPASTTADDTFITAAPSFEQPADTMAAEDTPNSPEPEHLLSNPFSHNNMVTNTGGLTLGGGDDGDQQQGPPSSAPSMLAVDTTKIGKDLDSDSVRDPGEGPLEGVNVILFRDGVAIAWDLTARTSSTVSTWVAFGLLGLWLDHRWQCCSPKMEQSTGY